MLRSIARRVGQTLVVLLGVATLVFFALRLIPGDPARVIAPTSSPEVQAEVRRSLGLDQPLGVQYLTYLRDLVTGDFGTSYFFDGSTLGLIGDALPYTLYLVVTALVLGLLVSMPLGALAARHRRAVTDRAVLGFSIVAQSTPNFLIALVGITLVASALSLPTVGYVGPVSLVLPSIALAVSLVGLLTQSIRNNLVATLDGSLTEALRSRGASVWQIILRHGARLSAVSVTNLLGVQLGFLLGGAVVIEYIFNYPGLGLLTLNAVLRRDYPLIQAITITTALVFVLLNLVIDLSHGYLDPRMRPARRRPARAPRATATVATAGGSAA